LPPGPRGELDPVRGLTVTEIVGAALTGGVRGMYMMGENPFLSDPNINKVRQALSALDFLAVQDIFLTETAEFADVVLPASSYLEKDGSYTNTDRRVQRGRKVLDPPGEARVDWEIIQDIANRIGLPMHYESTGEIFDELVSLMPNYTNLSYDNLGLTGKLYPNSDPSPASGARSRWRTAAAEVRPRPSPRCIDVAAPSRRADRRPGRRTRSRRGR
jgi:formate dehydrogenase major subunit